MTSFPFESTPENGTIDEMSLAHKGPLFRLATFCMAASVAFCWGDLGLVA